MSSPLHHAAAILTAIAWILCAMQALAQSPDSSRAESGRLFLELCAECHGADGAGGRYGPGILSSSSRELSNKQLRLVIARGRVNAGMPAFGRNLGFRGVDLLIAKVRELQGLPARPLPTRSAPPTSTDPGIVRGEALFRGKAGCLECHSIFEEGGTLGPDLMGVATRLSADAIREGVLQPARSIAKGFGAKRIVTRDGRTLYGRTRRESAQTLQLFDPEELLWTTYFKHELRSVEQTRDSLMPADAQQLLSPSELEDLFAFLSSLD